MSSIFRSGLLDGRVALVTGGGTGIGRATALELAGLGARVTIVGRRAEPLAQTRAQAAPGTIEAAACDIRDADAVAAAVSEIVEREGRIDLLVNNAGGQFLTPAEDISPKGFETVVRLNVMGTWNVTHAVATRAMIPSGRGGTIVNITLSPHMGVPGMSHSAASRAAVENLGRTLSTEWSRHGIRVNAIAAGQFGTDSFTAKYPPQLVAQVAGTVPVGRLGRAEEIAWLVAFLASEAGAFINGSVLTVDGGRDNHRGTWPPPEETDAEGRFLAEARRPPETA